VKSRYGTNKTGYSTWRVPEHDVFGQRQLIYDLIIEAAKFMPNVSSYFLTLTAGVTRCLQHDGWDVSLAMVNKILTV
jgi:hypothetical protein